MVITAKSKDIIFLFVLFFISITGISQKSGFSLGSDLIYSYSPVKVWDDSYTAIGGKGNFSPGIKLRYGNKMAGSFRMGYLRYLYEEDHYTHVNGGEAHQLFENTVHNIYADLCLEYAIFGNKGMFFYVGPAMLLPVKIKQVETNSFHGYYDSVYYDKRSVSANYFADFQFVIGLGGRILINKKNAICLESNFRFGIKEIYADFTGYGYYYDTRTYSIQFIIGYQFNFSKKD
jgi:hypothetical protein